MNAGSLLLPNVKIRRLKPSPSTSEGAGQGFLHLGLLPVPKVSQGNRSDFQPLTFGYEKKDFKGVEPLFFSPQTSEAYRKKQVFVSLDVPEAAKRQGFSIHRYRSGELTGARFTTGLDSSVSLNPRSGVVITQCLTQKARTKIRRAIQNAEHNFKCFLTVTFSPPKWHEFKPDFIGPPDYYAKTCKPWECASDGTVRHDFAKYKFKKFLHSISVSYIRKSEASGRIADLLAYVWVAEIQKNGNIHFHVLLNQRPPIKWLTSLWSQASNSIDVRSINNLNHASCYIRKYMEKEKSSVQGNRYAITRGLRKSMEPEKTVIDGRELQRNAFNIVRELSDTIESNGGKVLEHGFYLPTPCRSVLFRGSDGKTRKSMAVNAGVSHYLLDQVNLLINSLPF